MQREILFRGKLSHVNSWVEGNLIIANNGSQYIIPSNVFEPDGHHLIIYSDEPWCVDENTVCQFTGITDKNGTKIFDGDVVKHKFRRVWAEQEHTSIVVWNDNFMCYYLFDGVSYMRMREDVIYEVIGNAYDNPELVNK